MPQVIQFINELKSYTAPEVYNPWVDFDGKFDIGEMAPGIRCDQLEKYLRLRLDEAKYIFVAEALGYQGGHFSGIAMTSERILLGYHPIVHSSMVIGGNGQRTSNAGHPNIKKKCREEGYNEPTATIVWESILKNSKSPMDVILWNIFPFHPFKKGNLLTNRTPSLAELEAGAAYLRSLQNIIPNAQIISIGAKSDKTLAEFGIQHASVPHPANGGANDFRARIADLL
ncbi:Hypothetical protein LUCI_2452 [Lucifera butyrica]|uniref:Uracil-DNA glycosylase n=1 Tax=Lucifera butyrica TaxID=1351585 RepID=A0A498RDD7_9FIRM|nr:uracil-DNA glycosylase [Lucifera butyrica]VBB07208.1 Hypothetical protein LUCI_2452 [Lucifera butyrica]